MRFLLDLLQGRRATRRTHAWFDQASDDDYAAVADWINNEVPRGEPVDTWRISEAPEPVRRFVAETL